MVTHNIATDSKLFLEEPLTNEKLSYKGLPTRYVAILKTPAKKSKIHKGN